MSSLSNNLETLSLTTSPSEQDIMKNWKREEAPLLSICSITYNHQKFIHEALDSFLMQKTSFPFEIIIHDDASTDGTADIIKQYESNYPNIIKAIYQTENQYSKGVRRIFARFTFPHAKGKYIALCEGDDYWTDKYKLQKQIDFLELNKDFIFCGHDVGVKDESLNSFGQSCIYKKNSIELKDVVFGPPVHTSSWVFRNELKFPKHIYELVAGDDAMMCYLASKGKCHSLNEIMGVYRLSSAGTWSVLSQVEKDYRTLIIQLWTIKNYPIRLKDQTKQIYILVKNIKDYKSILSDNFSFQQKALAMLSVFAYKIFNSPEDITSFSNRIKGGLKRRIKSLKKTNYLS